MELLSRYLSAWTLDPVTAEPRPPESVFTVPAYGTDPRTGKKLVVATMDERRDNVESPVTAPGDIESWGGIHATQVSDTKGHYLVARAVPWWPFGGLLPVWSNDSARFDAELRYAGNHYSYTKKFAFGKAELRSLTEMTRLGGDLLKGPFVLPGSPMTGVPFGSLDLTSHVPVPLGKVQVALGTYLSRESGLLLPGSDDVFAYPGKVRLVVTKGDTEIPDGRPAEWTHSEEATGKTLVPESPGPRWAAPQLKSGAGAQLVVVRPIDTRDLVALGNWIAGLLGHAHGSAPCPPSPS